VNNTETRNTADKYQRPAVPGRRPGTAILTNPQGGLPSLVRSPFSHSPCPFPFPLNTSRKIQ
jgi:hypothetical protein